MLETKIREKCKSLGFERVGFASIHRSYHTHLLLEWLKKGYAADMRWIEETVEKRVDPQKYLPNAKSIIVVIANYFYKNENTQNESFTEIKPSNLAKYARGVDYHIVLKKKLKQVCEFIEKEIPTSKAIPCVDTSPVMEKYWAKMAGIGWQGKNSNIIVKDLGSYFFIGVIITTANLKPDKPFEFDHCGKCNRCIDACPTNAIVEPYIVNSQLCISYHTIENKGEIPPHIAKHINSTTIFGCDICQDVCPFNRFAKPTPIKEFQYEDKPIITVRDLFKISRKEFLKIFKNSPVKRVKYEGFLRNVKIALQNIELKNHKSSTQYQK